MILLDFQGKLIELFKNGMKFNPYSYAFSNYFLGKTDSMEDMGDFRWKICLSLLFCWTVVFLCLFKGVKTSGKVRLSSVYNCTILSVSEYF